MTLSLLVENEIHLTRDKKLAKNEKKNYFCGTTQKWKKEDYFCGMDEVYPSDIKESRFVYIFGGR